VYEGHRPVKGEKAIRRGLGLRQPEYVMPEKRHRTPLFVGAENSNGPPPKVEASKAKKVGGGKGIYLQKSDQPLFSPNLEEKRKGGRGMIVPERQGGGEVV